MSTQGKSLHEVILNIEDKFCKSQILSGHLRKDLSIGNASKGKKMYILNDYYYKRPLKNKKNIRLSHIEPKPSLTIKYLGEIQGEIGIGTTKVINSDPSNGLLTVGFLSKLNTTGNSRTYLHTSKYNSSQMSEKASKYRDFSLTARLPSVYKFVKNKPKILSESEYIYPERYKKRAYNLEDFYSYQNRNIRRFPSGSKYRPRFTDIRNPTSSHSNWKSKNIIL